MARDHTLGEPVCSCGRPKPAPRRWCCDRCFMAALNDRLPQAHFPRCDDYVDRVRFAEIVDEEL